MMGSQEMSLVPLTTGVNSNAMNTLLPSKNVQGTMPNSDAMPALMNGQAKDEINELNMNP